MRDWCRNCSVSSCMTVAWHGVCVIPTKLCVYCTVAALQWRTSFRKDMNRTVQYDTLLCCRLTVRNLHSACFCCPCSGAPASART
jgi:hypothetical protein